MKSASGNDPSVQSLRAFDAGAGTFAGSQHYVSDPVEWSGWRQDNVSGYDGLGNLNYEERYAFVTRPSGPTCGVLNCTMAVMDVTRRYSQYDAANRLRIITASTTRSYWSGDSTRTTTLEYLYDALGRRVLARYRGPYICRLENTPECRS